MEKNQIQRRIFQPNIVTEKLIVQYLDTVNKEGRGTSEFINMCIMDYFTPETAYLYLEADAIMQYMKNELKVEENYLKCALARAIESLNYPCADCNALENVMRHFRPTSGYSQSGADCLSKEKRKMLQEYMQYIAFINPRFNSDRDELGKLSWWIFENWKHLRTCRETYMVLSDIIEVEDIYIPLNCSKALLLIKMLDDAMLESMTNSELRLTSLKDTMHARKKSGPRNAII